MPSALMRNDPSTSQHATGCSACQGYVVGQGPMVSLDVARSGASLVAGQSGFHRHGAGGELGCRAVRRGLVETACWGSPTSSPNSNSVGDIRIPHAPWKTRACFESRSIAGKLSPKPRASRSTAMSWIESRTSKHQQVVAQSPEYLHL